MSPLQTTAAVLATAAGVAAVVFDYVSSESATEAPAIAGIAGAVTVGVAVLLFVGAVPRAQQRSRRAGHAAETALVTSAVGFLSVASAWTGLPFVLGTGGAMLGTAARQDTSPRQRGLAGFAIALGVAAVALGVVAVAAL